MQKINETNVCPVCNSADNSTLKARQNYNLEKLDGYGFASRKRPELMHYDLMECHLCKILYAINTLDAETVSRLYKAAEFDSAREAGYASKTYAKYIKKHLGSHTKGKSLLDIGTGEGSFLKIMRDEGADVWGVEPSDAPIKAADPAIRDRIINDVFGASLFADDMKFDIITCFQTMEHIPEPRKLIAQILALLRGGGHIYNSLS